MTRNTFEPKLTCEHCGKPATGSRFEMIIGGPIYYFCSATCMGNYAKENL